MPEGGRSQILDDRSRSRKSEDLKKHRLINPGLRENFEANRRNFPKMRAGKTTKRRSTQKEAEARGFFRLPRVLPQFN